MSSRMVLTLVVVMVGCKKEEPPAPVARDDRLGLRRCSGKPGPKNPRVPLLQRPFDKQFAVLNLFDHELPRNTPDEPRPLDAAQEELTYCGITAYGLMDGSSGYAFALPEGTPVLAPADGVVTFAGNPGAFICPITFQKVANELAVAVRHPPVSGVDYATWFGNLSSLSVKSGDTVLAGQRLGLSGQTGCATTPSMFFQVKQLTHTKSGEPTVVDPYGWDGPKPDPWEKAAGGAKSVYLWQDGEAPTLSPR
jgi:murein DD-endopeptidase MepM/ murein hydrolase activator NlpD